MARKTGQGCQTCRIRRVKCDRAIPSCNKCVMTGRTCDGKQQPDTSAQNVIKRLAAASPSGDERHLPTFSFPVTDYERNGFDLFRKYMVWPMTLVSPDPEWVYLTLQLCSTSLPTFYAVTAVSGAAWAMINVHDGILRRPRNISADDVAMKQYSKAMAATRRYMIEYGDSASPEPVLLASMLFACFEVYLENKDSLALQHIDYGREILRGYSQRPLKMSLQSCHSMILSMDRWSLDHVQVINPENPPKNSWPHSLSQSEDAHQSVKRIIQEADKLMQERLDWAEKHIDSLSLGLQHGPRYCLIRWIARMANQIHPDFQVDRLKHLRDQHTYWREPLLSRQCDPATPADLLLSIQFLLSDLLLSTCDAAEEETALFGTQFERTLGLMAVYLARWPECIMLDPPTLRHVGREAQTSFSLDPEVLPALNMMCYKCRNQDLRRRIIQLMYKMKRREGINYSVALADGCRWLANIEEKRAEDMGLDVKIIPKQASFGEAIIGHEIGCLKLHTSSVVRKPSGDAVELYTYAGGGDPMPLKPLKTQTLWFRTLGLANIPSSTPSTVSTTPTTSKPTPSSTTSKTPSSTAPP